MSHSDEGSAMGSFGRSESLIGSFRRSASVMSEDVQKRFAAGQMTLSFSRSGSLASMAAQPPSDRRRESTVAEDEKAVGQSQGIRWYMWPILFAIDSMGPLSTDTTTPALPDIAKDFRTTDHAAAGSYALNIVGTAVGSILIGILADMYGRKKTLMTTLLLYVVTLVLAAFSTDIVMFMGVRFVMGITQGCQVLAAVFARDLIDDTAQRMRVFAVLGGLNAFAIVAAPAIGGPIAQALGWRSMFLILAVLATCTLVAYGALIPETKPSADLDADDSCSEGGESALDRIRRTARHFAGSRLFVAFVGLFAVLMMPIEAFISLMPFLLQDYYHLGLGVSGVIQGSVPFFAMGGAVFAWVASKYLKPFSIVRVGMLPYFLVCALCVVFAFTYQSVPGWWLAVVPPVLIIIMTNAFIPVCMGFAMEDMKQYAGIAQGIAFGLNSAFKAAGTEIGIHLSNGTPFSYYGTLAIFMAVVQVWFWLSIGCCPPSSVTDDGTTEPEAKVDEEAPEATEALPTLLQAQAAASDETLASKGKEPSNEGVDTEQGEQGSAQNHTISI